jgi:predicted RNA-binding protein with TRAM domain
MIRTSSIMTVEEGKDVRVGVEDQGRRKGGVAIVAVLKRDGSRIH